MYLNDPNIKKENVDHKGLVDFHIFTRFISPNLGPPQKSVVLKRFTKQKVFSDIFESVIKSTPKVSPQCKLDKLVIHSFFGPVIHSPAENSSN